LTSAADVRAFVARVAPKPKMLASRRALTSMYIEWAIEDLNL